MKAITERVGVSRRRFVRVAAALGAVAALPGRVWAAVARPEAAFSSTGVDGALEALGGNASESADVILETPDIAENGAVVPAGVISNIPGTSRVYILVEKNPNPLAAMFEIPEGTSADVQTRVKVSQTGLIYGVVEAGGKLYMAKKETKVTLGGCGG